MAAHPAGRADMRTPVIPGSPSVAVPELVGRELVADQLFALCASAPRAAKLQHALVVGPPGSGRTALLAHLGARIRVELPAIKVIPVAGTRSRSVSPAAVVSAVEAGLAAPAASHNGSDPAMADPGAVRALLGRRVLVLAIDDLDDLSRALGEGGCVALLDWLARVGRVLVIGTLLGPAKPQGTVCVTGLPIPDPLRIGLDDLTVEQCVQVAAQMSGPLPAHALRQLEALHPLVGGRPARWRRLGPALATEPGDPWAAVRAELAEVPLATLAPGGSTRAQVLRSLAAPGVTRTIAELAARTELAAPELERAVTELLSDGTLQLRGLGMESVLQVNDPLLRHALADPPNVNLDLSIAVLLGAADALPPQGPGLAQDHEVRPFHRCLPVPSLPEYAARAPAPDTLLAEARRWAAGGHPGRTREAGLLAEVAIACATGSPRPDLRVLADRTARGAAELVVAQADAMDPRIPVPERVSQLLAAAAERTAGATAISLSMLVANCLGPADPRAARDLLLGRHVASTLPANDPVMLDLATELARWRALAGDPCNAATQLAETQSLRERESGAADPHSVASRAVLAAVMQAAGRPEALTLWRSVVLDQAQAHGSGHPMTFAGRSGLASCLRANGNLTASLAEHEALLSDAMASLGPQHPETLSAAANVAAAELALDRAVAAASRYERVLADRTATLGGQHPDSLGTRANLAAAWIGTGQVARGLAELESLRTLLAELGGESAPQYLAASANLAIACRDAGWYTRALQLQQELLDTRSAQLGPDDPATITALANLAGTQRAAGMPAVAVANYERVVARRAALLGPSHPRTLASRSRMATALLDAGRFAEGLDLAYGVLADSVRSHGTDHPHTVAARCSLGVAYREAGRLEEARELLRQAAADAARCLGEHPLAQTAAVELARTEESAGQLAGALAVLPEPYREHETRLGRDHPRTLLLALLADRVRARQGSRPGGTAQAPGPADTGLGPGHPLSLELARVAAEAQVLAGAAEAAAAHLAPAITAAARTMGASHPDVLAARCELAAINVAGDRRPSPFSELREVARLTAQTLGAEHPQVQAVLAQLAGLELDSGAVEHAVATWEQVVPATSGTLGAHHPNTLAAQVNLTAAHLRLATTDEARLLHGLAVDLAATAESKLGPEHDVTWHARCLALSCVARAGQAAPATRAAAELGAELAQAGRGASVPARLARAVLGEAAALAVRDPATLLRVLSLDPDAGAPASTEHRWPPELAGILPSGPGATGG